MSEILGRVNWLKIAEDKYHVMFVPYDGSSVAIIARSLSREDAIMLKGDLDRCLHTYFRILKDRENFEEVKEEEE